MIYDIQEEIYKILTRIESIKLVATDYPKSWETFPMAVFQTKRKPHFIDFDKQELQSDWSVTIEIYEDDSTNIMADIVRQIDTQIKNIGFMGNANDANTADLTRKICEYTAIVDNVTHFVYQK